MIGHYQPLLLLYASADVKPIDVSSAPDRVTRLPEPLPANQGLLYSNKMFFMVALCNRADITFSSCFFLLSSFFISSPNLSGQRLDVYDTSTHGVVLVRI